MATELWIVNILGIIFALAGSLFIIIKILPRVRDLIGSVFKDDVIVNSLMSLLVLLVYILLFIGVVNLIKNIDNQYLNFISVLDPGVDLILAILPYFKWLVFAVVLGLAFKYVKK